MARFLVNGVLVEAVLSEGGRFYDITVVKTKAKMRILVEIFEQYAKLVKPEEGK
jgi:hypothetical protein